MLIRTRSMGKSIRKKCPIPLKSKRNPIPRMRDPAHRKSAQTVRLRAGEARQKNARAAMDVRRSARTAVRVSMWDAGECIWACEQCPAPSECFGAALDDQDTAWELDGASLLSAFFDVEALTGGDLLMLSTAHSSGATTGANRGSIQSGNLCVSPSTIASVAGANASVFGGVYRVVWLRVPGHL